MRKVFAGLAVMLTLLVVAQFFFAATGGFSAAPNEESFAPHHALGYVIFVLPLVMCAVGALARVPGRLIGLSALVAGLTAVQVLLAEIAKSIGDSGNGITAGPLVFGLHGLNGLAILAVAGTIVRRARSLAAALAVGAKEKETPRENGE